ncbi:hypothetical protein BD289DRAFT_141792 [Coniella lustricola]|uniref:Uncharacterized protein n=1 Tax=Coniella lustricola TaxID=2025994 RepID=A0A2T2ZVA5_9PEZI|nr:hypothetical protein BD289DRAFT_141792 [Coniella lustricola]
MLPSICLRRATFPFLQTHSVLRASLNTTRCSIKRLGPCSLHELSLQFARQASTSTPKHKPQPRPKSKPEPVPAAPQKRFVASRAIVYHAGQPRILVLGGLKITAVFVLAFFSTMIVPGFIESGAPLWQTLGVMAAGVTPILAVSFLTTPMVMWIHLIIPKNFQHAPGALELLSKNVPIDTEVTLTTMGILGKPRVSHMKLRDLRKERRRSGLVNYVRTVNPEAAAQTRQWYKFAEMSEFKIEDHVISNRRTKQRWIWYAIWHNFEAKRDRMLQRQQAPPDHSQK